MRCQKCLSLELSERPRDLKRTLLKEESRVPLACCRDTPKQAQATDLWTLHDQVVLLNAQ